MKELAKDILISGFVGMMIPGMLLNFASSVWNKALQSQELQIVEKTRSVSMPVKRRSTGGTVAEMEMDDYLTGVVLAEMPASFEMEALKAQSIVARTYARKAYETGGKHEDGSVCTEPSCCQAWIAEDTFFQGGGTEEAVEKVRSAVLATSGQVLTYGGELIEATFFSCSGGRTEDALAVWGQDFPYLQAVDSPGEEAAAPYEDTIVYSPEEVMQRLEVALTGNPETWIGAATYTDGDGVDTIVIGGKYFTGVEIRRKLDLRSTVFSVSATENSVTFTTKGYGHRVGMSQYGADAMAAAGSTCQQILAHYYQGAELTQIPGMEQ